MPLSLDLIVVIVSFFSLVIFSIVRARSPLFMYCVESDVNFDDGLPVMVCGMVMI